VSGAWPTKPIRLVVPFPPGGGTDAFARPLGKVLSQQLGQPVVIDNRGGAGGTLGAEAAAKAPPDGYTFLLGAVHHAIAVSMYPKLGYDLQKDLAPVTIVSYVPNVVVVNPQKVPAKSFEEFQRLVKASPGRFNYASAGNGTAHHLTVEMWKRATGSFATHIPYRGAGPALQDLLAGQVDFMFDGLGSAMQHIRAGKLVPLAVSSAKRSFALPQVPTLAEAGVKGYEAQTWYAVWAPGRHAARDRAADAAGDREGAGRRSSPSAWAASAPSRRAAPRGDARLRRRRDRQVGEAVKDSGAKLDSARAPHDATTTRTSTPDRLATFPRRTRGAARSRRRRRRILERPRRRRRARIARTCSLAELPAGVADRGAGRQVARGAGAVPGDAARRARVLAAELTPYQSGEIDYFVATPSRGGGLRAGPARGSSRSRAARGTCSRSDDTGAHAARGGRGAGRTLRHRRSARPATWPRSSTRRDHRPQQGRDAVARQPREQRARAARYWRWRAGDVLLHALPIFHVHGLFVAAHGALLSGNRRSGCRVRPKDVVRRLPRARRLHGRADDVRAAARRAVVRRGRGAAGMRLFVSGRRRCWRHLPAVRGAHRQRDPRALRQ
jgi:tripartite-type tricarboxylate transporter receptor subunit TctC